MKIGGWAPHDLHEHEAEEVVRDRAEGVRLAYVAATRARDLLVVPAIGDEPWEGGWLAPLNRALYPPLATRQDARRAPEVSAGSSPRTACWFDRTTGMPDGRTVAPGLHEFDGYAVVVVRPAMAHARSQADVRRPAAGADRQGSRRASMVARGRRVYESWRASRDAARRDGAKPSRVVATAHEIAGRTVPDVMPAAVPVVTFARSRRRAQDGGPAWRRLRLAPARGPRGCAARRAGTGHRGILRGSWDARSARRRRGRRRSDEAGRTWLGHELFERARAAAALGGDAGAKRPSPTAAGWRRSSKASSIWRSKTRAMGRRGLQVRSGTRMAPESVYRRQVRRTAMRSRRRPAFLRRALAGEGLTAPGLSGHGRTGAAVRRSRFARGRHVRARHLHADAVELAVGGVRRGVAQEILDVQFLGDACGGGGNLARTLDNLRASPALGRDLAKRCGVDARVDRLPARVSRCRWRRRTRRCGGALPESRRVALLAVSAPSEMTSSAARSRERWATRGSAWTMAS